MKYLKIIFLLNFIILFALVVNAQQKQQINAIEVNGFKCTLQSNIAQWVENNNSVKEIIVQFSNPITTSQKIILNQSQVDLQDYLGDNTYTAIVNSKSNLRAINFIQGISNLLPQYKVAPIVTELSTKQKSLKILVSFVSNTQANEINQLIQKYNGEIINSHWQKTGLYTIDLPSSKLLKFAKSSIVKYISAPSENVGLDKDSKGLAAGVNISMPTKFGGKNLKGKGVMVGIGDNISGIYHIDQSDRVINYNNGTPTNHGVFVNSIAGGDGIMNWEAQGLASEGTFLNAFFDAILTLKTDFGKHYKMNLTNNSYAAIVASCANAGKYDNISQYMDSIAFVTPYQLDVFAAGNDGSLTCGGYPSGYYNICGGFQPSKNILVVGSTDRNRNVAGSSSRGPLRDGRIKPEICASGQNVLGGLYGNTYSYSSGTSFACPQVTGGLALITERFKQVNSDSLPTSDLLKGIIVNGATDLGRPGPDYWYGFGYMNIDRSIKIVENKSYFKNTIASGGAPQFYTVTVPTNTAQLKVMLYYHDEKASTMASRQLVNDLDITVTEPGGSVVHKPLILGTTSATVSQNAVEGVDRINNIEQVVIDNPSAGTYTIQIDGYSILTANQKYVVVYDFVPNELKINFPTEGVSAANNTDMYVSWDMPKTSLTSSIDFSSDNGATWLNLSSSVPATQLNYKFSVGIVNSAQCKIRIKNGGLFAESGPFIINTKPVVSLFPIQCPGNMAINWTTVPNASKYYVLLKKGAHFEKIDSVAPTITSYIIRGLNQTQKYYVSVQPLIDTLEGFRANALTYTPSSGSCIGYTSGDLAFTKIIYPNSGRRATSTELKKKTPLTIEIKNQSNATVNNYTIHYQINGGAWKSKPLMGIAPLSTFQPTIDSIDLSDTISYIIKMAVENKDMIDLVSTNDTITKQIKHIPNNKISLLATLDNDFESLPNYSIYNDSVGLDAKGYWDYYTSKPDTGRLRTSIPGSILVKSNRSISMDVKMNDLKTVNYLTGTFNLSRYDTSIDEIRIDFDYEMRGMPIIKDSNKLWVRGSDLQPWVSVMKYSNVFDTGKLHNSGTISLREILRSNNQNYSTSTQLRFGQFDSTLIVDDFYGGGITLDNIKLYKVLKDLQLTSIEEPNKSECNINSSKVTVNIKNGTIAPINGFKIAYSIDGKLPIIENYNDTLLGNAELSFTFSQGIDSLSFGAHQLTVWLNTPGDDFPNNDTINNYVFYNSKYYDTFPLLQDFELNGGGWYTNGNNSSWQYGIPTSEKINKAASGKKVWKTNLNGYYNSNENSYLVSPCLNTIGIANPMLSFSIAYELEQCAAPCDRVFIEYSLDNEQTWSILGESGKGTNWYNNNTHTCWNGENTRWHVASYELPRSNNLKLRFNIQTDLGTTMEGIAIDDIHIFDYVNGIASLNSVTHKSNLTSNINDSSWHNLLDNSEVILTTNVKNQKLTNIKSSVFSHSTLIEPELNQYIYPRSYLLQTDKPIANNINLRLYITDEEVNKILDDTSCATCTKAEDIYRTGITNFYDISKKREDSLLINNTKGEKRFFTYNNIKWVPYANGYYAEFETANTGEFWFNNGGVTNNIPANTKYITLTGKRLDMEQAQLKWVCNIDTQIKQYTLLRSIDSVHFDKLINIEANHTTPFEYIQIDKPSTEQDKKVYYQVSCTTLNNITLNSNIIPIEWTKANNLISIYPNPVDNGIVYFQWTAPIGDKAICKITDLGGKLVLTKDFVSTSWTNTTVFPLNFISKGIYHLQIQIGNNNYKEKLIIK